MTDREENVEEVSNATIEKETDDLRFSESVIEPTQESVDAAEEHKKEQEEDPQAHEDDSNNLAKEQDDDRGKIEQNVQQLFTRSSKEKVKIALYELYTDEKKLLKEMLQLWNRSNLAAYEDPTKEEREKKMKEGRVVIKDQDEDEDGSKKHKIEKSSELEDSSSSSRKGKEKMESDEPENVIDVVRLIRDVILEFVAWILHISEMARGRLKTEGIWTAHFETGVGVIRSLNGMLEILNLEMEMMRKKKKKEDFVKIHEVLSQLEEVNAVLDGSPNIGIVSERDCTELEIAMCDRELKMCKNTLTELMTRILKMQSDRFAQRLD